MTSPGVGTTASRGSAFDIIGRTVALLETVAAAPQPQTLSSLSRRIGAPKTTVHRLLDVLVRQDLLERGIDGYRLGTAMRRLSHLIVEQTPSDIVDLLEPFAGDLFERTGDYIVIGVPDDEFITTVHSIRSHRHSTMPAAAGRVLTEHSAIGKLWLAERLTSPVDRRMPRELQRIRQTGVATTIEQLDVGVVEIAMPVVGVRGMVAGIARRCPTGEPATIEAALAHHHIALAASAAARRFEARTGTLI